MTTTLEKPRLHVESILERSQLPADCVADCSAPGNVESAVEYWRQRLGFSVPRATAQRYLAASGAWSRAELALADNGTLWRRVLWLACCDFAEGGEFVCLTDY